MQLSQCAVFFFLLAWNGGTTEIKNDESRNDESLDTQCRAKDSEVLGEIISFLGQITPEEAAQFAFSEDEKLSYWWPLSAAFVLTWIGYKIGLLGNNK